jgi:hypothetical protein
MLVRSPRVHDIVAHLRLLVAGALLVGPSAVRPVAMADIAARAGAGAGVEVEAAAGVATARAAAGARALSEAAPKSVATSLCCYRPSKGALLTIVADCRGEIDQEHQRGSLARGLRAIWQYQRSRPADEPPVYVCPNLIV